MDNTNTIHIVGLGNVGKYVAHSLRKFNPDIRVSLLFHKPEPMLESWRKEGGGITLVKDGEPDFQSGFDILELYRGKKSRGLPIRNLIVATKGNSTVLALKPIKDRLNHETNILFLQNGMGASDWISKELFPRDKLWRPKYYAGICSAGVYNNSGKAFTVIQAGQGPLKVGQIAVSLRNTSVPQIENSTLLNALSKSTELLPLILSPNEIYVERLRKLAVNAVINPLTAIFGCRNGLLFSTEQRVQVAKDLISKEIGPVLRTVLFGTINDMQLREFEDDKLFETVHSVATRTGQNKSSMLQDAQRGCPTEIKFILGYLKARAEKNDIKTPTIERIIGKINYLEDKKEYYRVEGKCLTPTNEPYCKAVWPDIDWSNE
ncbi:putative 2-dehydropantoate 2-reductase [Cladorrhinum sp. PSN332]|nr:putative 2-dehydropantoate 2-reductase [Cladorrhinum sp. PSN332]